MESQTRNLVSKFNISIVVVLQIHTTSSRVIVIYFLLASASLRIQPALTHTAGDLETNTDSLGGAYSAPVPLSRYWRKINNIIEMQILITEKLWRPDACLPFGLSEETCKV